MSYAAHRIVHIFGECVFNAWVEFSYGILLVLQSNIRGNNDTRLYDRQDDV